MNDDFFDDFGWDEAFIIGGAMGWAEEDCEEAQEQHRLQEEHEREMERFSECFDCEPRDIFDDDLDR